MKSNVFVPIIKDFSSVGNDIHALAEPEQVYNITILFKKIQREIFSSKVFSYGNQIDRI